MSETYRAEITASIAQYAAEIAKIETETGKSATKAAAALVAKIGAGQKQAAAEATEAAKRSATAWQSAYLSNAAFAADAADAGAKTRAAAEAQATAAAAATNATNRNRMAIVGVGQQLSDVASQLATGTNPFTILIQQGPQVLSSLSMAEGGLSGVAAAAAPLISILGPVAVAVGALTGAYYLLNKQLDDATEKAAKAAEIATKTQAAYQAQAAVVADVAMQVRVASGELTKEQAAAEKQVASLEEQRSGMRALIADRVAAADAARKHAGTTVEEERAYRAAKGELDAYDAKTAQLGETIRLLADKEVEDAKAKDAQDKAAKRLQDRIEALNAAFAAETATAEANAKKFNAALSNLGGIGVSNPSAQSAADAEHAANLQRIAEESAAARAAANDNASAIETIEAAAYAARQREAERYYGVIAGLRANDAKAAGEAMRAETKAKQDAIDEQGAADAAYYARLQAYRQAQASATANLFGTMADAAGLAYDSIEGLSKKQAKVLFGIQKAAQVAQVAILAPSAVLQGLAQAGPLGGIAAGAAAAVQVAAILAAKPPSFRRGGYADERTVTASVEHGEGLAVVSRQGMATARSEGVNAVNAGIGGGGGLQNLTVNLVIDGRAAAQVLLAGLQDPEVQRRVRRVSVRPFGGR